MLHVARNQILKMGKPNNWFAHENFTSDTYHTEKCGYLTLDILQLYRGNVHLYEFKFEMLKSVK